MSMTTFNTEELRKIPLHVIIGNPHITRKIKIRCPFHKERTPSCVLFPTGGFKCFGCPAHGDSISFVMKLGATFHEACQELENYR